MVQRLELEKKVKLSLLLCASVAQSDIPMLVVFLDQHCN